MLIKQIKTDKVDTRTFSVVNLLKEHVFNA